MSTQPASTPPAGSRWRFLVALLAAGVVAGIAGITMALLLQGTQYVLFGSHHWSFADTVMAAPAWRTLVAVTLGATLAGTAWWALRRRGRVTGLDDLLRDEHTELVTWRTIADAALQVFVVGSGASIGRENAPRQMAAALADRLCRKLNISWEDRRLLVASSAAGGLAAVYNAPFAAVPFAMTILLRRWTLRGTIVSGVVGWMGTSIAWSVTRALPSLTTTVSPGPGVDVLAWWLVALVPLAALAGRLFSRACAAAQKRATTAHSPRRSIVRMTAAGLVTGAIGLFLPELLGNGKSTLDQLLGSPATAASRGALVLAAVLVLKPALTLLALRTGVVGGLLMPSAALGGALGTVLALVAADLTGVAASPDAIVLFTLAGAVGVLGITQKSPAFAIVFGLELTHGPWWLWPLVAAVAIGAHWTARGADAVRNRRDHST